MVTTSPRYFSFWGDYSLRPARTDRRATSPNPKLRATVLLASQYSNSQNRACSDNLCGQLTSINLGRPDTTKSSRGRVASGTARWVCGMVRWTGEMARSVYETVLGTREMVPRVYGMVPRIHGKVLQAYETVLQARIRGRARWDLLQRLFPS